MSVVNKYAFKEEMKRKQEEYDKRQKEKAAALNKKPTAVRKEGCGGEEKRVGEGTVAVDCA